VIAIIIVSWNVRALLQHCLTSLQQYPAKTHRQHIVVVDNASSDGTVEMVRELFPNVTLVANENNRGFTGGNNDGIKAADALFTCENPQASYLFLLNPDTMMLPESLDALLAFADASPDVGLVGPQLLCEDGTIQSSRRRFLNLHTAVFESTWLQRFAPAGLLDAYYMRDKPDDQICDVDWVYGAAMLVRRSTYLQCGVLDEQTFFMYSEEMDWCKRIKDTPINWAGSSSAHWRVVYLPQAQVMHYEARSSTQVSAKRAIYFNTSKVRYMHKHHGRVQATYLRIVLLAMFAEQTALEGVKWLAGHKRDMRMQRMKAYVAVLKSGLV
jgi:N-acetylglucosaminyl-diphospho-decaprenol L-rhamnosyltransferase